MRIDPSRLPRIADWMQGYVDTRRFAGCSTLILQDGSEAFYHDCGLRDVENAAPFTRDTVVRLYSMTKPVTSLAIMMLVERGLFHLDTPLSEFIPAFGNARCLRDGATHIDETEPCATPTLHQLMVHTSGLSYPFNPGVLSKAMEEEKLLFGPRGSVTLEQECERLAALPLAFHPGARWEYSVSIDVLGRVVEVASGKTLEQFFIDEIFDPLGMDETRFTVPTHAADRFAALYSPLEGDAFSVRAVAKTDETLRQVDGSAKSPFFNTTMHSGGGGLLGTIDDFAKFTEALRQGGGGLVSPATWAFMRRNHLPGDIASMGVTSFAEQPMNGVGFGMGGSVTLDPAVARVPGSVGDFSWGGMASTFFWIDPVHELSVVFLTQLAPSSSYPARPQLKALVHGALT